MSATEPKQSITPPSPGLDRANDGQFKVRVGARIRPFLPKEIKAAKGEPNSCLTLTKPNGDSEMGHLLHVEEHETNIKTSYKLDFCYGQEDEVTQIFNREVEGILEGLFRGCNATVFAYGASGSGKTHLMQGDKRTPGLMPLAISSLLSKTHNSDIRLEISYYEVYMDKCYDLLGPKSKSQVPISLLEDSEGHVQLLGLKKQEVSSIEQFEQILSYGCLGRKIGHTALNHVSSRSHGVLVIWVTYGHVVGKFNLIDLAGNEDNRRSKNEGLSLKESSTINQSLFALSNVIHALNVNEKRVPYRDSKLTRILQDSLGRTSRTLMIACLNPSSFYEALHTLNLAGRCTQIVNHDVKAKVDCKMVKPKQSLDAKGKLCLEVEGSKSDGNYKSSYSSSDLNDNGNSILKTEYTTSKEKSTLNFRRSKSDSNYKSNNSKTNFNTLHPTFVRKYCLDVEGPKSDDSSRLDHPTSISNAPHSTPKGKRDYAWDVFATIYNADHLYKMMFKNSFKEKNILCKAH